MNIKTQFFLCCVSSFVFNACANVQTVGVRPDFKSRQVSKIIVAPTYAVGTFGLDKTEFVKISQDYDQAIVAYLKMRGFDIISPQAFEQRLVEYGQWEFFQQGLKFDQSLHYYFEPGLNHSESAVALSLQTLAKKNAWPENATFLVGEIVYQSHGHCRISAEDIDKYAITKTHKSITKANKDYCIISHFQAKLIEPHSAKTMWFNKGLREFYIPRYSHIFEQENITSTVATVLGGQGGLTEFKQR